MRRLRHPSSFILACALTACGASGTPARGTAAAEPPAELWSEPEEYAAVAISAEAGERYFNETGVGDPYGAGVPFPVYRGWMARWPETLGANFSELADRFGFLRNAERPDDPEALPVGFHRARDPNTGVDFLVTNCALCHADRVRTPDGETLVTGMGNRRVRIHAYVAALLDLAERPEVSATGTRRAADAEAARLALAWPERHRAALSAASVRELRARLTPRAQSIRRLAEGLPGRVATVEGFIIAMNTFRHTELTLPAVTGWARVPDVRPWRWRETNSFDGASIGSPVALVAEADFAFGARPRWYETHRHIPTSMYLYLRRLDRDLPYPGSIDATLAARGYALFEGRCAACHGHYARPGESERVSYQERVIPIAQIGTDAARLDALTEAFASAADDIDETRGLILTRASDGYVPRPLVDVWARGHYGHNGQWPDLRVIATPPAERPRRFVVHASAPLDLERVGQRWSPATGEATLGPGDYVYDATAPGHGVQGHEFLSALPPEDRGAVIEYLKTL